MPAPDVLTKWSDTLPAWAAISGQSPIRPRWPEFRRAITRLRTGMDRRFDRLERTKVDKAEFRTTITRLRTGLRAEIATSAAETRRYVNATASELRSTLRDEIGTSAAETRQYVDRLGTVLRDEIASAAAETRRHFDVVAEAIRDDIRIFAEALAGHSNRLDTHNARITALERRSI